MDKNRIKEIASFTLAWSVFIIVASAVIGIGSWITEKIYSKLCEKSEKKKEREELRKEINEIKKRKEANP